MNKKKSDFDKVFSAWDILVIAFGAMIGWGWVVSTGGWIEKGGVVGICQVFRQLFPTGFEESGIFEKHDTALCQKRQRLCQIDDLSQGEILPLIEMGVHLVAILAQRLTQTGRVLVLQITFLSVEQVDLFEIAGFDVFIDPLHK